MGKISKFLLLKGGSGNDTLSKWRKWELMPFSLLGLNLGKKKFVILKSGSGNDLLLKWWKWE